jgi:hypothetical protein
MRRAPERPGGYGEPVNKIRAERTEPMYIGLGTVVFILIVVLIIYLARRA